MKKTETENGIKPVVWVGSSHEDLKVFPPDVQDEIWQIIPSVQETSLRIWGFRILMKD